MQYINGKGFTLCNALASETLSLTRDLIYCAGQQTV